MNMKKIVSAMVATSLVVIPTTSTVANDRALFKANAVNVVGNDPPLIRAGYAPVDDGVARIVPPPYRVMIDDSIPASMQIVWGSGDNWMEVLRRALAPVDLVVEPDWANNVIKIYPNRKSAQAVAGQDQKGGMSGTLDDKGRIVRSNNLDPAMPVTAAVHAAGTTVDHGGGFIVTQQSQTPQSGGFLVTRSHAAADANPSPAMPQPVLIRKESAEKLVSDRKGELPPPDVMWRLMKAAVARDRITLSGVSSLADEKERAKYGRMYAVKLRENLLKVGFPSDIVVLAEEHGGKAERGGVLIVIGKGGN